MKINCLRLISFGKFKNKTINFSDGINFIYGKNESGKSTIMAFIKAMLYGFTGRGPDGDRNRYKPWDGEVLSGEMDVTLSDGRRVIIKRVSGRTPAKDELVCLDALTGEKCDIDPAKEIGVGESTFLKSVFIRQTESATMRSDEELTDRLINLAGSGDMDISFDAAMQYLRDKIRFYKHQRGDGGQIAEIKKEISRLQSEIESKEAENKRILSYLVREKNLQKENQALQERYRTLLRQREGIKKAQFLAEGDAAKKRVITLSQERDKLEAELLDLNREAEALSCFDRAIDDTVFLSLENPASMEMQYAKESKNELCLALLSALLAFTGIILGILIQPLYFVFLLFSVVLFLLSGRRRKNRVDLRETLERIRTAKLKQTEELELFGCESLKEYLEKKAKKQTIDERIHFIKEKLELLIGEVISATKSLELWNSHTEKFKGITEDSGDIDAVNAEISETEKLIADKARELAIIEGIKVGTTEAKNTPDLLRTQEAYLVESLAEAEKKVLALELAAKTLEDVYNTLSRDFTPGLNEKASVYFSMLTGRENENLLLDKNLSVTVEREAHRPIKSFSEGTIDQAFFAVRLSLADLILNDNTMPIFLDESFNQYDNSREENALNLLLGLAKTRQVFWFSCKDRDTSSMYRIEI